MSNQNTTTNDAPVLRKTFTAPYSVKRNASFYPGADCASPEVLDSITYLLENIVHGLDTINIFYKNTKLIRFELITQQHGFYIDKIKSNCKNSEIKFLDPGETKLSNVFNDTLFNVSIAIVDGSAQSTPVDTLCDLEKKVMALRKEVDKKREENKTRFSRIKLLLTELNTVMTEIAKQEEACSQINGLEKQLDGILVDGNIACDAAKLAYKEAIGIGNKYLY